MRVELKPVDHWRHDLGHCLHTTAAVLVAFHRLDPVEVLGAGWGFRYPPGDARREEYYFPGHPDDLFRGLAPYHRLSSRWHHPVDAADGWRQVRAALAGGAPVAVAVDNFHLPFRPAYRDVHTNHLLAVYGFDDDAGQVFVADPVPPSFQGPIPVAVFTAARDSGNPVRHDRDMFFTANPIANRWLELTVGPEQPVFDRDFVDAVIAANVRGFAADDTDDVLLGLGGLRRYLTGGVDRLGGCADLVDELFIVAGPVLAVTGLHAEFLDRAGRTFRDVRLLELGRAVDRIAHHWTAWRIAVATARADPPAAVAALRRRVHALLDAYAGVLDRMSTLVAR